jgi:CBS domain-containing protein
MRASDVMVTHVITVGPEASVQQVAQVLLTNRISAVPVVDSDGRILGMVSEGDLMRRAEAGTARDRPWWLAILIDRRAIRGMERSRSRGSVIRAASTLRCLQTRFQLRLRFARPRTDMKIRSSAANPW